MMRQLCSPWRSLNAVSASMQRKSGKNRRKMDLIRYARAHISECSLDQKTPFDPRQSALFRGDVVGWRRGAFAKEILLHLTDDDFLIFSSCGVQAIFIQQHLAKFRPLVPGLL